MDFGKYKYEQTKKDKLQRKHQHVTQLKELRFHPNTDEHDFQFKIRHAERFLEEGHKVKATVVFKGREITYSAHGAEVLKRVEEALADVAKVDQVPKLEGRSMAMILSPEKGLKKKTSGKSKDGKDLESGGDGVAKTPKAAKETKAPKETKELKEIKQS